MKIFVPGRICLFGEHSDWAGGYRRINADIEKGQAIICGTNQGLHAEVKPHPTKLILRATLNDGTAVEPFELPMNRDALAEAAQAGGFFSYAAGVAYQVMTHYRVRGLEINNTLTDLPVKKGLSSSAAVCVLIARAFNRTYDLKLTTRGEMELAYLGEITTPSRCGRLDQGCAYGNRPIAMTFDGDQLDVREISIKKDMHFVIVDLHAAKDTHEILRHLNRSYPFSETELHQNVQDYLGPINADIVARTHKALEAGDAEAVGALMIEAQAAFDKHLQPACPSQLTAPVLHKVLAYDALKPYIYGGKGVGSQGDGTAQFIARDEASQDKIVEIIEGELEMSCLKLSLTPVRKVRKAVIPAAGFGAPLFPATKAIKKELFPVVDAEGRAKPVILAIVEEALSAGIDQVAIIVQREDQELFEDIFCTPPPIESFNQLSKKDQDYCTYLTDIGNRITFIPQDLQDGFGHAVYCARDWVGDEPFLLLLGDHLYASDVDASCTRQMLDIYDKYGQNTVGVKRTKGEKVESFGCVSGIWRDENETLTITDVYEKPHIEYARQHLHIDSMDDDEFLTIFGQYVLNSKIFDYLEEQMRLNMRVKGQFQLTPCLDRMRQEDGFIGYVVQGRRFDIGTPATYRDTIANFR
ncbi:MAG: UTP-glucose-1-phosphate uridylyltransferase/mevalonate kinase [Candidatus Promineifilaceae bacterium]|jgi:UTP-glucose-1-phosphate uridylyltransferase/mevalonate kinase